MRLTALDDDSLTLLGKTSLFMVRVASLQRATVLCCDTLRLCDFAAMQENPWSLSRHEVAGGDRLGRSASEWNKRAGSAVADLLRT
jgi:hypothetical protein